MTEKPHRTRTRFAALVLLMVCATTNTIAEDGAELYKSKICYTCHGMQPDQPVLPAYPKLSGQNVDYLFQQMKDIRDGHRANALSAAMKTVVGSVTDDEFKAISDWLATQ